MSNVQIVKLTTGEDVMGEISEVELDGYGKILQIKNPVAILLRPKDDRAEAFAVGLAPYAIYAENHILPIMPGHIVSIFTPEDRLEQEYRTKISGIQPVTGSIAQQILKEGKH